MNGYADTGFLCSLYAPDAHTARAIASMKRHTIACCSEDLDGMLATIPKDGIQRVNASTGETNTVDRTAMRKKHETHFAGRETRKTALPPTPPGPAGGAAGGGGGTRPGGW